MSIENKINGVIQTKLEEGIVEKLVAENFEKGINNALDKLMGNYGDVTKVIEQKIKEVMVGYLESYDYSEYIFKLDHVLTEILQVTTMDNKKILENFKELIKDSDIPKVVKLSDIFKRFQKYVAKDIHTDNLEVNYDDGVSYDFVSVTMEVEYEDKRSWSSFQYASVIFECEKDNKLNCEIRLSKYNQYPWSLSMEFNTSIESLRRLTEFQIYLMKLRQAGVDIELDSDYLQEDIEVEAEPEASFS